jgi:hypothetical protein
MQHHHRALTPNRRYPDKPAEGLAINAQAVIVSSKNRATDSALPHPRFNGTIGCARMHYWQQAVSDQSHLSIND